MRQKEKEEGSKKERVQAGSRTKKEPHMSEEKTSAQFYEAIKLLIREAKLQLPPQRFNILAYDVRTELQRPVQS